jgi:hypothetical protein
MSDKFMYEFGEILSVYLNAVLFVDLYLTIKNPFFQREKRVKWYYIGAAGVLVLMLLLYYFFEKT